ncbi:tetratricopeptide repeat protein [Marivirga sp. S37H4]|uniref:Tetratricopeptide repeat protein n=1 Tax=Marivirga aurantiaca TaxID=2802615 RepID=A0A935C7C5_9BACT|nr:tetratricopeptide repeat protein [Marivirga aurantiaca]MBK6264834.1 tetratricopeptide repeat protein [Marivirga aurantiaca]
MIKSSKSILIAILMMAVCSFGFSQSGNEEAINRAKMKYSKSIQYNDFAIAKDAIYDLMVLEPNNSAYLDSLAYMYFEFQQYASAALVSRDALNRNSNNRLMLQIGAKSLEELGALDQSLKMYERLYSLSDDAFVLFEIIQKQYDLKKYDDAMINSELLLGKPAVERNNVYVKNEAEEEIEAPFKAVVYNVQGMIARAQGNEEAAKQYFNKALKLAPNYALAKENLNPSEK